MATENQHTEPQTKAIWTTFWILLGITALEFLIAFTVSPELKWTRIGVFVILTLVKAFYIVAEFMHLKHEVKALIMTIVLPCIFVMWFVAAMLWEGGYIFDGSLFFKK